MRWQLAREEGAKKEFLKLKGKASCVYADGNHWEEGGKTWRRMGSRTGDSHLMRSTIYLQVKVCMSRHLFLTPQSVFSNSPSYPTYNFTFIL